MKGLAQFSDLCCWSVFLWIMGRIWDYVSLFSHSTTSSIQTHFLRQAKATLSPSQDHTSQFPFHHNWIPNWVIILSLLATCWMYSSCVHLWPSFNGHSTSCHHAPNPTYDHIHSYPFSLTCPISTTFQSLMSPQPLWLREVEMEDQDIWIKRVVIGIIILPISMWLKHLYQNDITYPWQYLYEQSLCSECDCGSEWAAGGFALLTSSRDCFAEKVLRKQKNPMRASTSVSTRRGLNPHFGIKAVKE